MTFFRRISAPDSNSQVASPRRCKSLKGPINMLGENTHKNKNKKGFPEVIDASASLQYEYTRHTTSTTPATKTAPTTPTPTRPASTTPTTADHQAVQTSSHSPNKQPTSPRASSPSDRLSPLASSPPFFRPSDLFS